MTELTDLNPGLRGVLASLSRLLPYGDRLKIMVKRALSDHGAHLPGHYYSPVPSRADVLARLGSSYPVLEDVDLNRDGQFALLQELATHYPEVSFPHYPEAGKRYYYDNNFFSYADAIFLSCILRRFRPERIIEIGSGHSSAVMLDTIDSLPDYNPEITFVEPYPERLYGALNDEDKKRYRVIEAPLGAVGDELFGELTENDLLFVDSSHVLKYGSDVQRLFFAILPRLRPGVIVHVHDVFNDFEYPEQWLRGGAYFNEAYILRSFLSGNVNWEVLLYETDILEEYPDYVSEMFPLVNTRHGSSFYMRKKCACAG